MPTKRFSVRQIVTPVLIGSQILTYWWCSPPRLGTRSSRLMGSMARVASNMVTREHYAEGELMLAALTPHYRRGDGDLSFFDVAGCNEICREAFAVGVCIGCRGRKSPCP